MKNLVKDIYNDSIINVDQFFKLLGNPRFNVLDYNQLTPHVWA